jgi:hypothetical protein
MSSPPYPASNRPDEDEYDGPDDGDDFQATQTGGGTQTQTQQSTQDSNSPNDYCEFRSRLGIALQKELASS